MVALPDVTSPTVIAIDAAVAAAETRRHHPYIRGSAIGQCERRQWYAFRWSHAPEQFDGRVLRLFDTGNVEEDRMVAWLKLAGVEVLPVDPDTAQQWEVKACDGHFAGHFDGIIMSGIIEAPKAQHLLECKTHNAKSFAQLLRHGVAVAKPDHMAQMQIYMHLAGLTRAFYLAKNKDTDELYAERVHYDAAIGLMLEAKAERIKAANSAPERIGGADHFECRFCPSHGLCHGGQWALRNCRTCAFSDPINDGQWYCQRHERELTNIDQLSGCPSHVYLPSLVPLEQFDADAERGTVSYLTPDKGVWIDGEGAPHG